jgi:hypothetical protein
VIPRFQSGRSRVRIPGRTGSDPGWVKKKSYRVALGYRPPRRMKVTKVYESAGLYSVWVYGMYISVCRWYTVAPLAWLTGALAN